jgi:hypothetical protein
MKISIDDPKLTAYALGEMQATERVEFGRQLARSPELRATVEEIRAVAAALQSEFAIEGKIEPRLATAQRFDHATSADNVIPLRPGPTTFTGIITAVAACGVALIAWQFWGSDTYLNTGATAGSLGQIGGSGTPPSALYDIHRQYYGPSELESTQSGSDVDSGPHPSSPIEPVRFAYDYPVRDAKRADQGDRFSFSVSYQQNF